MVILGIVIFVFAVFGLVWIMIKRDRAIENLKRYPVSASSVDTRRRANKTTTLNSYNQVNDTPDNTASFLSAAVLADDVLDSPHSPNDWGSDCSVDHGSDFGGGGFDSGGGDCGGGD